MENIIFYYTGTGNSLWVARILAKELGDCQVQSITDWQTAINFKEGDIKLKMLGWHSLFTFGEFPEGFWNF